MICPVCLKNFKPNDHRQSYCSRKCCKAAYYNRECSRDELPAPNAIRYFHCEECGRGVNIFEKSDPRYRFCCGKCYMKNKNRRKAERRRRLRSDNNGVSSGMSLGSLIKRERRDLE